jgi:hypothetical protein
MAIYPPGPRLPKPEFAPPPQIASARSHYDGIKHAFSCAIYAASTAEDKIEITTFGDTTKRYITDAISTNTTFVNLAENETAKKAYQKEQQKIKVTLKKYGIEISEWKLYISQWA